MSIIYITGGARSGKSHFAETLLRDHSKAAYIATAKITDDEMKERIRLHQIRRPKEWDTFEADHDLIDLFHQVDQTYDGLLLDCWTLYLSQLLFRIPFKVDDLDLNLEKKLEKIVMVEQNRLIAIAKKSKTLYYIVSNEIGSGIVPADRLSRFYRDLLGRTNQIWAQSAIRAYALISGISICLKDVT